MKSVYLFSALASGLVMLSACSNEEGLVPGGDLANESAQQIVLQVADAGEGIQTRAGRPLYGSEAKQSIENVKVIICDSENKVVFTSTVEDWNTTNGSTPYTSGGHGRQKTIEIPEAEKLKAGTYTVYAFGYHTGSDYAIDAITDAATGDEFNANTVLSFKNGATNKIGEEIFAGSLNLTVKANTGFKTPVVLNRQVAGTFGYFEAIPYLEGAAKLQLVASQLNTQLVLGKFGNYDLTDNGNNNNAHVNYVVNGATASAGNVVYSINLKDWFTEIKDADNDGLVDTEGNWAIPAAYKGKANFKTGSVFGGEFVIPFAKVAGKKTFVLQMVKEDGTVLRSWTVKLPSTDSQCDPYVLWAWNGADFISSANAIDDVTGYNVVRNHLYGIGEKALDNPTNPNPDPENPDPDNPEPLNKKQELTLRVNDNWEVIHKMVIEQD